MHPLVRALRAASLTGVVARVSITVIAAVVGLSGLRQSLNWLLTTEIYRKDFLAVYVLARAIAAGADPYLPINLLAARFIGTLPILVFDHATPHPPTLGLLALPLAALPYSAAAWVWFGMEIIGLAIVATLLIHIAGMRASPWVLTPLVLGLPGWYPVIDDLRFGQMNVLILLCLTGMTLALRHERHSLAGGLLTLALLIKPIAWPIGLALLLKRDWRALMSSTVIGLAGVIVATAVIGPQHALAYVTEALPTTSHIYSNFFWNNSVWSIGPRLFVGTVFWITPGQPLLVTSPLVAAEQLVNLTSMATASVVLGLAIWHSRSLRAEWALGLMTTLSIVINPLSWPHYHILALLPLALILNRLRDLDFPIRQTTWALLVGFFLATAYPVWITAAHRVASFLPRDDPAGQLSFWPSMLTIMPTVIILFVGLLIIVLARTTPAQTPVEGKDTTAGTQTETLITRGLASERS